MQNAGKSVHLSDVVASTTRAQQLAETNIKSIEGVSKTLRVLSLNALLEASRAGQQGKAFSIVAQEVKTIASQVESFAKALSSDLGGEMAALDQLARRMSLEANGRRTIDLALNAIELMDRNLYERTCDVRWWATDSAVVGAAAEPAPQALAYASKRLGVILKAYTVYLDLWLCDLSGRVIANGRPERYAVAGTSVADRDWFRQGLRLADGDSFAASTVYRERGLGGAQAATYVASVRQHGDSNGRALGILAVHFDWETQANAILRGVRLSPDERERTRVLLTDQQGLVLAASDGRGALTETIPLNLHGRPSGFDTDDSGTVYAFHKTPGYETYAGLGWYGVLVQADT